MDEVIGVRLPTSLIHHFRNILVRLLSDVKTIQNVLLDSAAKEHRLLLHKRDLLVVPSWLQSSDIFSIEENRTRIRFVESFQHRDD